MWLTLYRALWVLARPAALLVARGDSKIARAVRGRRAAAATLAAWAAQHRDTRRPLAWFHAASVGEGRQAEAVMRRWRERHPDWQIVYTHSSASAEKLAASLPADIACYVPADVPGDVARALDALRPAMIVFSATDLWPELVRQASSRGVRLALISATLAPTSSRRGTIARAVLGPAYGALDRAGAISTDDAAGLRALGARRDAIVVTGDTRHDAAAARAAAVRLDMPELQWLSSAGRPVVLAGSTWDSDERPLLQAARDAGRNVTLVIAPHEPSEKHVAALRAAAASQLGNAAITRLSEFDASSRRRSDAATSSFSDVVIVDRVGILADLYAAAQIAFVGGGFHDAGLHSVIEPAALGVPVLFGPKWRSSRDAALLLEAGGARSCADAGELTRALREWLENEESRRVAGLAARQVVDAGIGAADRSVAMLEDMLQKN